MKQPLPSIKRPFDLVRTKNKKYLPKRGRTESPLNATVVDTSLKPNSKPLNMSFVGQNLNVSEIQPKQTGKIKDNSFSLYSIPNPSITGINVMSSLKPTQIRARCSIYTAKMGIQTGIRRSAL